MKTRPLLLGTLLTAALAQSALAAPDSHGQKMQEHRHSMNTERKAEQEEYREQRSMGKRDDRPMMGDDDSSGDARRLERKMKENKAGKPE